MRKAAGDAIPRISEWLILDEIGAGVARLRQEFGPVDAVFGIAHRGGRPAFARPQPVLQMAVGDPAGEEVDGIAVVAGLGSADVARIVVEADPNWEFGQQPFQPVTMRRRRRLCWRRSCGTAGARRFKRK